MPSNVESAASALRDARMSGKQIAPVSTTYGLETIDEAYAAAKLNAQLRIAEGRRVTGRKIGLTAIAVQKQLGVDQPDFGTLFDDMEFLDRAVIPSSGLMQPKIEAEIAFVIAQDIEQSRAQSWGEFVNTIDHALPALEIVDSAIADWKIGILDTVADNASASLYVLGDQPVSVNSFQLAGVDVVVRCNGNIVSEGRGSACLGHPLRAAYWLACEMTRRGEALRAGDVILSGALGPTAPVESRDIFEADFGAFGRVGCQFA